MTAAETPESHYVDTKVGKIHYLDIGDSEEIILCVHGAGPGASGWSNFRLLAPHLLDRYRLIVPDLPQFGRSDMRPIEGGRFAHNAAALTDLLAEITNKPVNIIGNSVGGSSSIRLALDNPQQVKKVVIMGSTLGYPYPPGIEEWPPRGIVKLMAYPSSPSKEAMRSMLEDFVYDKRILTDDIVEERYSASIEEGHLNSMKESAKAGLQLEDLTPELSELTRPVLLSWALEDRFSSLECGLLFAKLIPDSRMFVFPRCGHWAHIERPAEFARVVTSFFQD